MDRIEKLSRAFSHDYFAETGLEKYRAAGSICPKELERLLFGREFESRRLFFQHVIDNPRVFSHSFIEEEDRPQKRYSSAIKLKKMMEEARKLIPNTSKMTLYTIGVHSYDLALSVKFGVHYYLYYKTLFFLGTERH
jgi:acyl-CoA oxidase